VDRGAIGGSQRGGIDGMAALAGAGANLDPDPDSLSQQQW